MPDFSELTCSPLATEHIGDEISHDGLHLLVLDEDTGIEVNPGGLAYCQTRIGRNLHGGHECAERGAAACGEEHHLASGGGKGCRGHEVVAGGREQVETVVVDALAIFEYAEYGALARFLCAAEGLLLEGRDAAGLVARRGVLANGLAVAEEILLEIVDKRDGRAEQRV